MRLFILLLLLVGCTKNNPYSEDCNIALELGISFPPVADGQQRDFTAPLLQELGVKRIRIADRWSFREPTPGVFNWGPLDERIAWAEAQGLAILLTIQSEGPDWACSSVSNTNSCIYNNNADFQNYVEQLLQRYPNRIAKIQFGNEWMSDFWYIGTGAQFAAANNIVYDAVQQYSPDTKVVLGGFTSISLRIMAACDGLIEVLQDDDGNTYNRQYLDDNCGTDPTVQQARAKIDVVLNTARYD